MLSVGHRFFSFTLRPICYSRTSSERRRHAQIPSCRVGEHPANRHTADYNSGGRPTDHGTVLCAPASGCTGDRSRESRRHLGGAVRTAATSTIVAACPLALAAIQYSQASISVLRL